MGSPGHPEGTHTNGYDMDMGYFQVGTGETTGCAPSATTTRTAARPTTAPTSPSPSIPGAPPRTLGFFHHSPQTRVIGVDGRVGGLVDSAMDQLCEAGFMDGGACQARTRKITYEPTNEGRGHLPLHHHWHISLTTRRNAGLNASAGAGEAHLRADCGEAEWPMGSPYALRRLPGPCWSAAWASPPRRAPPSPPPGPWSSSTCSTTSSASTPTTTDPKRPVLSCASWPPSSCWPSPARPWPTATTPGPTCM
ncbi:MAG: hypothetical protein R3F43_12435 [bacterium]